MTTRFMPRTCTLQSSDGTWHDYPYIFPFTLIYDIQDSETVPLTVAHMELSETNVIGQFA